MHSTLSINLKNALTMQAFSECSWFYIEPFSLLKDPWRTVFFKCVEIGSNKYSSVNVEYSQDLRVLLSAVGVRGGLICHALSAVYRHCPKKNKYLQNGKFTGEGKDVLYFQCKSV